MVFRRKLGLKEDFNNTGDGQIRAPGFHYAVDFQLNRTKRFGHGVNDFKQSPRLTAREVAMLGVMNALTDKPSWEEKVLDDDIVTKWGEEARRIPLMSQKAWEWCVLELRDKARRFQKKGRVLVLDAASRISKSDTTVSETLHRELRDAVQPLLEQPDDGKDWHPGSEGQVLDLVHPSLFPLVFGRTRVLMDGGTVPLDLSNTDLFDTGKIAPQQSSAAGRASRRFQWLPCEVHFKEDTRTDVEITSYINNLHPSNKKAYAAIEKIISLAIPAWNEVLVHGRDGRTPPRIRTYGAQFAEALPEWYGDLWAAEQNRERNPDAYKEARRKVAEYCGFEDRDEEQETDDEDVDIEDEAMSVDEDEIGPEYVEESGLSAAVEAYYLRHVRQVVHPEPGQSFTYRQWKAGLTGKGVVPRSCSPCSSSSDEEDSDEEDSRHDENYYSLRLQDDFREQGLQVVVKLASIELTPEKPEYAGGSWHVEGFLNEHIVATALYYYEVENVTEARISFRTEAGLDQEEMQYDQGTSAGGLVAHAC